MQCSKWYAARGLTDLLDHVVGPDEEIKRHLKAKLLGGLLVYYQLKLRWLLDRQVCGPRALENFGDDDRGLPPRLS